MEVVFVRKTSRSAKNYHLDHIRANPVAPTDASGEDRYMRP